MNIDFEKNREILIVYLNGELDHNSAEQVRTKIDDKIDKDDIRNVILNFKSVTFMDSSGIGAVVGRYKKVNMRNGVLCICNVSDNVNKIFELAGLYKIIKKYDTVEEAVKDM